MTRICVVCKDKVSMPYLAIFGCRVGKKPLFCKECNSLPYCEKKYDTENLSSGGYCPDCFAEIMSSKIEVCRL